MILFGDCGHSCNAVAAIRGCFKLLRDSLLRSNRCLNVLASDSAPAVGPRRGAAALNETDVVGAAREFFRYRLKDGQEPFGALPAAKIIKKCIYS